MSVVYLLIGSALGRFRRKFVVALVAGLCLAFAAYHLVLILIGDKSSCRCFGDLDLFNGFSCIMVPGECSLIVVALSRHDEVDFGNWVNSALAA